MTDPPGPADRCDSALPGPGAVAGGGPEHAASRNAVTAAKKMEYWRFMDVYTVPYNSVTTSWQAIL